MENANPQPDPARYVIKWTDGEHAWCLDISHLGSKLATTAPIGQTNQQAYAQGWAKAYAFIKDGQPNR